MGTKLTFKNLDALIDSWVTEMQDYVNNFKNQSAELNDVFWRVGFNEKKIKALGIKLHLIGYLDEQIQKDVARIDVLEKDVEEMISKLEMTVTPLQGKCPVDITRERIYGLAENINCALECNKHDAEALATATVQHKTKSMTEPIQMLAQIMTALLEGLKHAEMEMHRMKDQLNLIHYASSRIACEKINCS